MDETPEVDLESSGRSSPSRTREFVGYAALVLTVLSLLGVKFGLNSGSAEAQNAQATVNQVKDQLTDLKGRMSAIEDRERQEQNETNALRLELQKVEDDLRYATDAERPYRKR